MSSSRRTSFAICAALLLLIPACTGETSSDGRHGEQVTSDSAGVETRLPVAVDGRWGYIDASGDLVVEPRFDRAWKYSNGLALVRVDGRYGYVGPDGAFVVEPRFTDAWHFSGGLAPVETDSAWAYVDRSGRVVADTQFSTSASTFVEMQYDEPPLQLVSSGGLYGYADEDGGSVIDPRFERAWRFSEGLARVKSDGRWGYIDRSGEFVIEPRFDLAWDFQHGVAMVRLDDQLGYIDRSGAYVWNPAR